MIANVTGPGGIASDALKGADLHQAARDIETNFLSLMLESAGLGQTSESFGGGAGEDQFASFLRRSQAEQMVSAGGIGLAEHLFNSLKTRMENGT
ncbi:rod-binding protein [Oceaniglobus trochenteri]|uniref:rod-binding protein n=1 Tax=Oceaniglobus trochenteri TaxID=2763260 RepID=UPI001CFFE451|nr:rod-binding protein [Oceaniglobus trochenteri]